MLRSIFFLCVCGISATALADTLSQSNLPNGSVFGNCVFFEQSGSGCSPTGAYTPFGANYIAQLSRLSGRDEATLRTLAPSAFSDSIYNATWRATCLDDSATGFRDSDGDGRADGFELGDPCCVWTLGTLPLRATDLGNPGLETSTPVGTPEVSCTQEITIQPASTGGPQRLQLRGGCTLVSNTPISSPTQIIGYLGFLFVVIRRRKKLNML
jgi:hypothetical protein